MFPGIVAIIQLLQWLHFNTLRPRQNGRRFADDTFKRIFYNEKVRILIKISLKFVPKGPISNNPALVKIMAWRRSGDKPLSEPMMVSLPTHICVTRPQWVKSLTNEGTNEFKKCFTVSESPDPLSVDLAGCAEFVAGRRHRWIWIICPVYLSSVLHEVHACLWYRRRESTRV